MNYQEMIGAIKKAKIIYVYVHFTVHDGHNVSISKKQALEITKNMNQYDPEYKATFYESNNSLYIG